MSENYARRRRRRYTLQLAFGIHRYAHLHKTNYLQNAIRITHISTPTPPRYIEMYLRGTLYCMHIAPTKYGCARWFISSPLAPRSAA